MFRPMRRVGQALSREECIAVLQRGTSGVLAVSGENGYPYAVPLSYVYANDRLYFHCARSGHKLDAIARNPKVSFCVIDQDRVVPEKFTTFYRSVIAFGTARIIQDEAVARKALEVLTNRYCPDDITGTQQEIENSFPHLYMVEITIDHLTGKQAKELVAPNA